MPKNEPVFFEYTLTVPHSAIDVHGITNNAQYVRWMEEAAIAHSTENGWGANECQAIGGTWKVRNHSIEYISPALVGDTVTVATRIKSFGRATLDREYFIRKEDVILVEAITTWVWVDFETGRPLRVPVEIASSFSQGT